MATMSYESYCSALDALWDEVGRTPFPDDEKYPYPGPGPRRAPYPVPRKLYARHKALMEADVEWPSWAIRARREALANEQRESTMTTLTPAQRRARADAIIAESARSGKGIVEATRVVNRAMFGETARPARIRETMRPASRLSAGKAARKAAKRARETQRLTRVVTEALTAAAAPRPAPGTTAAAQRPAASPTPDVPLHTLDVDQFSRIDVVSAVSASAQSPFWRGARESAPTAPVTESVVAVAARDAADLAKLDNDQLDAVAARLNPQRSAFSPRRVA